MYLFLLSSKLFKMSFQCQFVLWILKIGLFLWVFKIWSLTPVSASPRIMDREELSDFLCSVYYS